MRGSRDIAIPTGLVTQVTPSGARRLGLVVGIDAYADSGIPNLKAAVADARAMHELMVDPECGLFDPRRTTLLLDSQATEREIKRELGRIAREASPDDEVWIYFAGHGILADGEHRLVPADGEQRLLDETTLPFAALARRIRCRRKIVFLDCCHSGASDASTRDIHSIESLLKCYDGSGTITFCSSDGHEKSVELPDVGRGAFSYWLERGLRGEADSDGDGVVSSGELWDFVRGNVEREALKRTGSRQTPRVKLDASGSFALSFSRGSARPTYAPAIGVEEQMKLVRSLMGEEAHHLTPEEVKAVRCILESSDEQDRKAVRRIRKTLDIFRADGDEEFAVRTIHDVLQAQTPSAVPFAPRAAVVEAAENWKSHLRIALNLASPRLSAPPRHTPPRKFRNPPRYAKVESGSSMLVLYEDTLFGLAGDGFLLSWKGIHWRNFFEAPNFLPWERFGTIHAKLGMFVAHTIEIVDSSGNNCPCIHITFMTPDCLTALSALINSTARLMQAGTQPAIEAALQE